MGIIRIHLMIYFLECIIFVMQPVECFVWDMRLGQSVIPATKAVRTILIRKNSLEITLFNSNLSTEHC